MLCSYKKFKCVKLCPSDLRNLISINSRQITGDSPDDSGQANTNLQEIQKIYAAIETPTAYKPISGASTGGNITHVFYVRFDDMQVGFSTLNFHQHAIIDANNVVYRIESIENMANLNQTLAIYCRMTGNQPQSLA